jgi:DNA polymerase
MAGAEEYVPAGAGITELSKAVHDCRGCDLYADATQAVFGEGPADATVVVVGEVPGDQEDKQGHPFVGPAGKLLDRALKKPASTGTRCTSRTR